LIGTVVTSPHQTTFGASFTVPKTAAIVSPSSTRGTSTSPASACGGRVSARMIALSPMLTRSETMIPMTGKTT
jgi:hypothetical protein